MMRTLLNEEENHYSNFVETLSFPFDSPEKLSAAVKLNREVYSNVLVRTVWSRHAEKDNRCKPAYCIRGRIL
ncbi:MAG: hypothetical protein KAR40_17045 [Candidatus Sabulitectum sp.]|nr:hypothetical protein [Candidatus Sabulitectum sp.]